MRNDYHGGVVTTNVLAKGHWQDTISPHLRTLRKTGASYSPGAPSLVHYQRVSRILLDRFGDPVLAKAAYLHGVHPDELEQVRTLPDVEPEVAAILDERNRLRSIGGGNYAELLFNDAEGEEVARQLVANVLPLIRDARSVILFVIEQIDHLDGSGIISDWTLRFRWSPTPVPRESVLFLADHFPNMRARIRFLRYVVAAAADWFGLWAERNAALNLAFLHEDREAFESVVDIILDDAKSERSLSRERVALVRERLGDTFADVRWQWYLADSIQRNVVAPFGLDDVDKRFDRFGSVTVVCDDDADCYTALARLHAAGDFIDTAIRDYIGSPRPSGYRALHTSIARKGDTALSEVIPVNFVPQSVWRQRLRPSGAEQMDRMIGRISRDEHRSLTVLTYDGRAIDLPLGSTVLNFALKLHSHMLPLVRGGIVNRSSVDLLHPLHDGDFVRLEKGTTPQLLPDGWEAHVPAVTVPKIRKEFPRAYRRTLEENGMRWLRAYLSPQGLDEVSDEELVDAVVSAAGEVLPPHQLTDLRQQIERDKRVHNPRYVFTKEELFAWINRQFGSHEAMERGVKILTPAFDRTQALAIAARATVHLRESPSITTDFELPAEYAGQFDSMITCDICEPSSAEPRSAKVEDRVLVIHRAQAACGAGGRLLRRPLRPTDRRHYFTIESSNRTDNVVDILSAFHEFEVDVANISALRLAAGWRVIRIGCDYLSTDRRAQLKQRLLDITGVMRVTGPDDDAIPAVEDSLPPRSTDTPALRRREPYQAGPPIEDDYLFYGQEAPLQHLTDAFDRVSKRDTGYGEFVFITGPMRIGKTSLTKQFIRRLNGNVARPHLALYHMPSMDRWRAVAEEIRRKLLAFIPYLPPSLEQQTLESAIRLVRGATDATLVIAIDEIAGLLTLNTQWPEEIAAFRRFNETIRATPGVMVIWIGPRLATQRLDSAIRELLNKSEEIVPLTFVDEEVDSLLRAKNMGALYRITPAGNLSRSVRQLTAGNPYWVMSMGKEMFARQNKLHGQQLMTYSYDTLRYAKEQLFLENRVFHHHVDVSSADRGDRMRFAILRVLAQPRRSNQFVTRECLAEALRDQMSEAELSSYVEDLFLSGSIVIENSRLKIAAPLLAQYIRYITDMRDHENAE